MSSSLEQAEALAEAEFTKGSVDALKKRVDQLRAENDLLKKQRGQSEKETHEFVAYFQQELEKKDELIAKLNDQLLRSELQSKRALEDMRAQQEATVEEMKQEHGTQVAKLKSNLKLSKEELTSLNEFRHSKAKMEKALSEAQQALEAKEGKHREEMLALERRLLEQKRKEQQEFEAKMEEIRRQARVDAQQGLDDDTRKIVTDNLRMGDELKFQLSATDELQKERNQSQKQNEELRRELKLVADKEQVLVRRSYLRGKEVSELQGKVKELEMSLSRVVRNAEKERERLLLKHKQEVEEVQLEVAGLRQLVKLKNKELRTVKKLAQTILDQRTEVEQFFLDALDKVKDEVRKRRKEQRKQAEGEERARRRQALVGGGGPLGHAQSAGTAAIARGGGRARGRGIDGAQGVDLRDLGWEERERVLRLLFAKMNSVHGYADALPSHALEGQGDWEEADGGGGAPHYAGAEGTVPHVFMTEGGGGARGEDDHGDPHERVGATGGRWGQSRTQVGEGEEHEGERAEGQGRLPRGHVAGNAAAAAAALGGAQTGTGAAKQRPRMA